MSEFLQQLLTPFQYDYMLRAIWVSALVGGTCGFLSSFVTLKGWSLMGDALSHAVVPGVAVAYILGLPFALGAFVAGLLAAGTMAFVKARSRIREDATIGIVFTAYFALGLLLISLFPARVDLKVILLGNILAVSDPDIWQVAIISAVTVGVLVLKWRDLMLFCFDANQARTLGLRAGLLHITLLSLLAATSVAALQAVGACLVVAMLITPGATAYLLTDRFGKMLWLSSAMGVLTSLAGAYSSYYFNGATGGCIVTLQALLFLAAFVFAPKHGILAAKRRLRLAAPQP
ncbi:metal ABC transporter permease [Luteolibacter yonseiensis]|uniref:Metal ABC transporter permease n=1 Tax=Luteolibacter yonseiensis TaxID=1144680 RepID=A0A934R1H7_9BACT|nr:metal ABC transporter permease [Luteolibacter yonseiensis]MBK1814606.1 metal ABC transporter permease [Luteolibacter yonseiensis]